MVKGHPSIAVAVFDKVGIDLKTFKYYINNFDEICNILIEYYSVENEEHMTKDQIKWLFNMMIYGGSYNTWFQNIQIGDLKKGVQTNQT
jgi:hypothetical protein